MIDPWDSSTSSAAPVRRTAVAIAAPVRDDWEDDDDEPEQTPEPNPGTIHNSQPTSITTSAISSNEDENKRIWDNANIHVPVPMPTLVLSPSATSPVLPPPPGAFQPAMRILKRTTGAHTPPKQVTSPVGKSIQDREERYAKARVRIFGDDSEASTKTVGNNTVNGKQSKAQSEQVRVIRAPKGPPQANGEVKSSNPSGFGERSRLPPPNSKA